MQNIKKNLTQHVAYGLAWLMLLLSVLYSLVSKRPLWVNADLIYVPTLYRDLAEWGGKFSDWVLTPAPYIFPDMGVYILIERLVGNFGLSLMLGGVAQLLLFCVGWVMALHVVAPSTRVARRMAITFLMTVALLICFDKRLGFHVTRFPFLLTYHFGVAVCTPYVLALVSWQQRTKSPVQGAVALTGIVLLGSLVMLSDALYVVQLAIPLCAVVLLRQVRGAGVRAWLTVIGVVSSMLLGLGLYRWSVPSQQLDSVLEPLTIRRALDSAENFSAWLSTFVADAVWLAAIFVLLIAAVISMAIWPWLKKKTLSETWFVSSFIVASIACTLPSVILTGLFFDTESLRYVYPLLFLPFVVPALCVGHFRWERGGRNGLIALIILVAVVTLPSFAKLEKLQVYRLTATPLSNCVDREAKQRNLQAGISNYWDSKMLSMLSAENIKLLQVTPYLTPYAWISNPSWYRDYVPQFALIDTTRPIDRRLSAETLFARFGEPSEQVECPGALFLVYDQNPLFMHYLAERTELDRFAHSGTSDQYAALFFDSDIGSVAGNSRVASEGEAGALIYGPHVRLAVGTYEIEVVYSAETPQTWDIALDTGEASPDLIVEAVLAPTQTSAKAQIEIVTPYGVQVRAHYNGAGAFKVDNVLFRRVSQ